MFVTKELQDKFIGTFKDNFSLTQLFFTGLNNENILRSNSFFSLKIDLSVYIQQKLDKDERMVSGL